MDTQQEQINRLSKAVSVLMLSDFSPTDLAHFVAATRKVYAPGIGMLPDTVEQVIRATMPDVTLVLRERLTDLENYENVVSYLNMAGVDNWQGCEYAYELARDDGVELDF